MTDTLPPTKSPLWMRITLVVSLALNLLVVGLVAGFVLSGGPDKRDERQPRDVGSLYMRALEPEDRRALRREFVAGLAQRGRDRNAVVTDMQTTLDVLRMSPFDAEAFRQAMADQSTRRTQREDIGRQVLAARVAGMTDAERAAYADRVEAGLEDLARRVRR